MLSGSHRGAGALVFPCCALGVLPPRGGSSARGFSPRQLPESSSLLSAPSWQEVTGASGGRGRCQAVAGKSTCSAQALHRAALEVSLLSVTVNREGLPILESEFLEKRLHRPIREPLDQQELGRPGGSGPECVYRVVRCPCLTWGPAAR